ncbi:TPA: PhoPQ-activated protein PqaA family protein [Salmonella enterica]
MLILWIFLRMKNSVVLSMSVRMNASLRSTLMTYKLAFNESALKEWKKLGHTIQEQFKKNLLTVYFSEAPVKVVRWTANNPNARDFRYACGIRYQPLTIDIPANNKISITLNEPKTGWEATYIEATFNDGYVATSQVYITPDEKYPQTAPPSVNAACQTLPGRGLGENDSPD